MKKILLASILLFFCISGFTQTLASTAKVFAGNNYNWHYARFNWQIDPQVDSVKGSVCSYFVALNDMNKINFDFSKNMQIDSIIFHAQQMGYIQTSDDVLEINLSDTIHTGTTDSICIYYGGAPNNNTGFGAFIQDQHGPNNDPIIFTLSEPYGTKEWWPCKNDLSDKLDSIDIYVTHPLGHHAASNGILISEIETNGSITAHWKHQHSIAAYLIAISVSNYIIYSDWHINGTDSLEILNYVFPEDSATAMLGTSATSDFIHVYENLFIDYPFWDEKYGHAQFTWGGGMEHQTMSFMGGFSYELVSHELAHQWFGDYITCGSWHDIWLNEGFATYMTGLCYEFKDSQASQWLMPWRELQINKVTSAVDGSVYVEDTTSVSRVFSSRLSYSKGAMVLHGLRWTLGDSIFFQACKNYLNDTNLSNAYAYTADLKNHFEQASGVNLTKFFNDWVYNQGHPVYQINCTLNPTTFSGNLEVNQSTSHNSVNVFEMPLPIYFADTIMGIDTLLIFQNDSNHQNYNFQLDFLPNKVVFDPELWICTPHFEVNFSVGIEESTEKINCLLYPNPCEKNIHLHSTSFIKNITLINSQGMSIKNYALSQNISTFELDLSAYTSGVYFIIIETEHKLIRKKIIKL